MAILKHIVSKSSNYGAALEYLIFKHDELRKAPILDQNGNRIMRDEFYLDGLNCEPYSFDAACQQLNREYQKNKNKNEIKSHHYIISFDPRDSTENCLTGKRAQELGLEYAKANFPGHQALVCTHIDGHNGSGNIHVHIVINSLRKLDVPKQPFMERPIDCKAGYKHHVTNEYLKHLQKSLMDLCRREFLHQVDLLSPSRTGVTEAEYWAQRRLDEKKQKIETEGFTPNPTKFQTQKQLIRDAVAAAREKAISYEDFQDILQDEYNIFVKTQRGRYSYLPPERNKFMARVSKKVSAAQREAENAPHRIWKTAIYARLSDFDDVLRDTESLEVQISYIKEYINHRDDLMLLDVFADKRCTGMNFDRPEFERLLKSLQERKIDCIVVKDFSRLGRNFVETGQYLEQVFPLFGVRFIAINDNYDSLNNQSRDGMLVPIKSMINEMYSKDLSQKIQSCFRSKEARGEIYTPVPFGYKRNQQNHLVLDEKVSDVVIQIFLWKKSGMKEREIAKKLSAQGIQTPFTRRCQLGYLKNTLRVKDPAWQTVFVTKVLENPIYTGTMVYNRIAYDETNRKIGQNPRESWRMVPDSHPAIISWELFDEVSALREAEQAVKEERKKWCRQRRKNNPNIFKGRIFCKKCGEKLVCHWQSDGTLYFYCASCHVSISEKDLWNGIHKELYQRLEEHKYLKKLMQKNSGKSNLETKKVALSREMEQVSGNIVRLESQKRSGYERYVLGKLSKEKFLELKQDAENEIETFRQTKAEKEKELAVVQEKLQQKKQIAGNTEVLLTVDNLLQYVKKIEVDRRKITYTEFVF